MFACSICKLYVIIFLASVLTSEAAPRGIFRKYKIVHEAVERIRNRPEFPYDLRIRKFNRTTPVLDGDFAIMDDKVGNFTMWVEGFERLGMEHIYTRSAVSLSSTLCEFITGKWGFNRGFHNFGNLPASCPIKAGNYTLRNWVMEDKYLPPFVPGKFWRLDFYLGPPGVKVHSNETGKYSYYCKVVYI